MTDHVALDESKPLLKHQLSVDYTKGVYIPVYILFIIFAISSWISVLGLWVEVPLFVERQPEGWTLPSYLIIVVQIANVVLIIWALLRRFTKVSETAAVYFLLSVATAATVLVGIFWQETSYFAGAERSVALLSLVGVVAMVDCSSTIIFLPFAARFHSPKYVAAYSLGAWLGGIITGVFALAQGIGKDPTCVNGTDFNTTGHLVPVYSPPNFSVGVFCSLLCVLLIASALAFTALIALPKFRQHMVNPALSFSHSQSSQCQDDDVADTSDSLVHSSANFPVGNGYNQVDSVIRSTEILTQCPADKVDTTVIVMSMMPRSHLVIYLLMAFWRNALCYSFLPSLNPFSCLPYGNMTYTLVVRLTSIASPLMCIVAMRWSTCSINRLIGLTVFATALGGYLIALAVMSPEPVLQHEVMGQVLVIVVSVVVAALFAYVSVVSAMALRVSAGARGLVWFGVVAQFGSIAGAVLAFLLINVFHLFVSKPVCSI